MASVSWSTYLPYTPAEDAEQALRGLTLHPSADERSLTQLRAAVDAAATVVRSGALGEGGMIAASLSGHAPDPAVPTSYDVASISFSLSCRARTPDDAPQVADAPAVGVGSGA